MSSSLTIQPTLDHPSRKFCTFRLGTFLYGVDILDVKEINRETSFTPIPHTPSLVRGYTNLRGQIFLVLDLRLLLGLDPIRVDADTRLVLFKPAVGDNLGVLVDRIGDIVTLSSADIEASEAKFEDGVGSDLVAGVGKLERGLVLLLDPRKIPQKVEEKLSRQANGDQP